MLIVFLFYKFRNLKKNINEVFKRLVILGDNR